MKDVIEQAIDSLLENDSISSTGISPESFNEFVEETAFVLYDIYNSIAKQKQVTSGMLNKNSLYQNLTKLTLEYINNEIEFAAGEPKRLIFDFEESYWKEVIVPALAASGAWKYKHGGFGPRSIQSGINKYLDTNPKPYLPRMLDNLNLQASAHLA